MWKFAVFFLTHGKKNGDNMKKQPYVVFFGLS